MVLIWLIMLFVRPTRGLGGPDRFNNAIRTSNQRTRCSYSRFNNVNFELPGERYKEMILLIIN